MGYFYNTYDKNHQALDGHLNAQTTSALTVYTLQNKAM